MSNTTFTSTSDFLTRARPGDTYTEPRPGKRSLTTYRFVARLTAADDEQCREGSHGGVVETVTTTHEGKAEYVSHRPEYAYVSQVSTNRMFAGGNFIRVVIGVTRTEQGAYGVLDVCGAKRMSAKGLAERHEFALRVFEDCFPFVAPAAA